MSNKNSTTELLIDYYSTNSTTEELKVVLVGSPQFITLCLTELLQRNQQVALNGIYSESSEFPDDAVMDTCDLVLIEQNFTRSTTFIHPRFKHKVYFMNQIEFGNTLPDSLKPTAGLTENPMEVPAEKMDTPEDNSIVNQIIPINNQFSLKYGLSKRESHTLHYLINGYSYKMIASEMFISIDTVRSHIKRIYRKLGINCIAQAIVKVLQETQHGNN